MPLCRDVLDDMLRLPMLLDPRELLPPPLRFDTPVRFEPALPPARFETPADDPPRFPPPERLLSPVWAAARLEAEVPPPLVWPRVVPPYLPAVALSP